MATNNGSRSIVLASALSVDNLAENVENVVSKGDVPAVSSMAVKEAYGNVTIAKIRRRAAKKADDFVDAQIDRACRQAFGDDFADDVVMYRELQAEARKRVKARLDARPKSVINVAE